MIPNKSNFKFQELTPITGVKPYVLRFWESEFQEISPVVSDSGQKLYARKDIEVILRIKKMLFDDKMSIQEVKEAMHKGEVVESILPRPTSLSSQRKEGLVKEIINSSLELIKELKLKRKW